MGGEYERKGWRESHVEREREGGMDEKEIERERKRERWGVGREK